MNHDTTPELIIAVAASKSTWVSVASIGLGWLVSNNAAIVVGMVCAVCIVFIHWFFRRKDDKRSEAADARAAELNALFIAAAQIKA